MASVSRGQCCLHVANLIFRHSDSIVHGERRTNVDTLRVGRLTVRGHASRTCSRDIYLESYITEYNFVYKRKPLAHNNVQRPGVCAEPHWGPLGSRVLSWGDPTPTPKQHPMGTVHRASVNHWGFVSGFGVWDSGVGKPDPQKPEQCYMVNP